MRRALVVLLCVALPARAEAWNPLKAFAEKAAAAGRAIGGVLGAPAAGFIEAATTPVIDNVENAGHRLIADTDRLLADNLARAGGLITQAGAQVDTTIATVDRTMTARILQVQAGVDHTIDHAFDRIDRTLGDLDRSAERLLDRASGMIKQVDAIATARLADFDQRLTARIRDVQLLVSSSIEQADDVARERLAQLDDLAGRRLGNLDVIATKQSLSIEAMLLRLATLIGLVALIAFAAWRGFRETADAIALATQHKSPRLRMVGHSALVRLLPQLALACGGALVLHFLASYLPREPERRACAQIEHHAAGFAAAVAAFDIAEARYHESQLEILAPDNLPMIRARLKKAELLHTLFTRPGQLHSQRGLSDLVAQIADVEAAIGAGDPDVTIAKAYVLWQVGGSRDDEYEAATLCADALRGGGALLAPLGRNYIAMFLAQPYRPRDGARANLDELARLAALPRAPDETHRFDRVIEFDRLVADLDRASNAAYLDMLAAHAELQLALARRGVSAAAAARSARTAAAEKLIDAWRAFDHALASSAALASDTLALSVFTLDDAVLTRARYYAAVPTTNDLAPTLTGEPARSLAPSLRARIAPLRIAWERRYAPLLGPSERDIVSYQETERFTAFETRARTFEAAYVDFLVAARTGAAAPKLLQLATLAATRASSMSLYRATATGTITEASSILAIAHEHGGDASTEVQETIARNYQVRRLRLL